MDEEVVEGHLDVALPEVEELQEVVHEVVHSAVAHSDVEHPEEAALVEAPLEEEEGVSVVAAEVEASQMYHMV